MRSLFAAGAVFFVAITSGVAAEQGCTGQSEFINKNWYCSPVKSIHYTGVAGKGTYNKVTHINGETGACVKEPKEYGGTLAPLNEEVSIHIKGPLQLKRFAVYTPGSAKKRSTHHRRHDHQHFHQHNKEIREIQEREAKGEEVVVTVSGKVQSWINQYDGSAATPAPQAAATANNVGGGPSPVSKAQPAAPSFNAGKGSWGRQAYYNAADGTADGLVFLNARGVASSMTSLGNLGLPLSYASADGSASAASPQTLKDAVLADTDEVMIFSDKQCSNGDCGVVRPESVAYHGFGGAEKAFLMEFSMPLSGKVGQNLDTPAIWMLNTQIPQTQQYGDCSCWDSGCGEFDLFEVLDSGNTRCKSTFHMKKPGGASDYFKRPTTGTLTAIVVLSGDNDAAHIKVLDAGHSFDTTLSSKDIGDFCSVDKDTSTFRLVEQSK